MWGLSVDLACRIHDADYARGGTWKDKQDADCRLLHNLYILIQNEPTNWLTALRYERAVNYYEMVAIGGKRAFLKAQEAVT
jgi:hypothetical protein